MSIFDELAAEFPRDLVSWRCQTVSSDNTGLALAYIDARDVMRRLDSVVGPENWTDRYEVHGSKTICYLSVRVNGEWIVKADGAGDTDVEAEKGSISDAFKRAAVKWGIGRYLYDLDSPWVPCEVSEKNGKKFWKRWTADPWKHVKGAPQPITKAPAVNPNKTPMQEARQNANRVDALVGKPSPVEVQTDAFNLPVISGAQAYVSLAKTAINNCTSVQEIDDWWVNEAPEREKHGITGAVDRTTGEISGTKEFIELTDVRLKRRGELKRRAA